MPLIYLHLSVLLRTLEGVWKYILLIRIYFFSYGIMSHNNQLAGVCPQLVKKR